jgi:acylphosphatase
MERLEVRFTGHVQGVGFRYTTHRIARRWRVVGYVENCPDGAVLMVAEGERDELNGFVDEVIAEMQPNIRNAEKNWYAASGEWSEFVIRR